MNALHMVVATGVYAGCATGWECRARIVGQYPVFVRTFNSRTSGATVYTMIHEWLAETFGFDEEDRTHVFAWSAGAETMERLRFGPNWPLDVSVLVMGVCGFTSPFKAMQAVGFDDRSTPFTAEARLARLSELVPLLLARSREQRQICEGEEHLLSKLPQWFVDGVAKVH